jgi:hypothetical protein
MKISSLRLVVHWAEYLFCLVAPKSAVGTEYVAIFRVDLVERVWQSTTPTGESAESIGHTKGDIDITRIRFMKRQQPDEVDGCSSGRCRTASTQQSRRYVRLRDPDLVGPESAAPFLFASWSRAERGRGSEADASLWNQFLVIDPADPQAALRLAPLRGIRPSVLVFRLHESLWCVLSRSPTVNQYLCDRTTAPLPTVADLLQGARLLLGRRPLKSTISGLLSPNGSRVESALKALVGAMAKALDVRPMVEWGPTDEPFYATPMPLGSWASALHALDPRYDRRRAYYVLGVRLEDNSVIILLSGPHSATERGRSSGSINHVRVRADDNIDSLLVHTATIGPRSWSDTTSILPIEWLTLFLVAIGYKPEWPRVPWLDPLPAGAAQVKRVMAPLDSIYAIPPTTMLALWLIGHTPDIGSIRALSGAWIDERQLLVAITVFAGQAAARRALPLFGERPSTLFDAAVDAAALSPTETHRPVLPDDVIHRSAPRLWQRVCAAPATKAGTLVGARLLPRIARCVGIPVGEAESQRPELLCASLAAHMVPAQAMWRYGSPVAPTSVQARLAGKRVARSLRDIWVRSCGSTTPLSDRDLERIEAVGRSIKVDLPRTPSDLCAFMAPAMVGPALPEIKDPEEQDNNDGGDD